VYINNNYYGQSLSTILLNTGDSVRMVVTKTDSNLDSSLTFTTQIN
jgi:hypothetical protein